MKAGTIKSTNINPNPIVEVGQFSSFLKAGTSSMLYTGLTLLRIFEKGLLKGRDILFLNAHRPTVRRPHFDFLKWRGRNHPTLSASVHFDRTGILEMNCQQIKNVLI